MHGGCAPNKAPKYSTHAAIWDVEWTAKATNVGNKKRVQEKNIARNITRNIKKHMAISLGLGKILAMLKTRILPAKKEERLMQITPLKGKKGKNIMIRTEM